MLQHKSQLFVRKQLQFEKIVFKCQSHGKGVHGPYIETAYFLYIFFYINRSIICFDVYYNTICRALTLKIIFACGSLQVR